MSTKDNIDYIKDELSSEEKFLESSVKIERFYKKYKTIIIGVVAVAVLAVIGNTISSYMDEQNKKEANIAFNKLLEDPNDAEALSSLKSNNEKLYEIAKYLKAKKEGKIEQINIEYLKELTQYEKALDSADVAAISSVSLDNNFLLKENAIFNKALLEAKNGNYKSAKETLTQIPENSKINDLVVLLKHFLASK